MYDFLPVGSSFPSSVTVFDYDKGEVVGTFTADDIANMQKEFAMLHKLPDGKTTADYNQYISEWHNLARVITENTNWELTRFDPDFEFGFQQNRIVLPVFFVKQLRDAFLENCL